MTEQGDRQELLAPLVHRVVRPSRLALPLRRADLRPHHADLRHLLHLRHGRFAILRKNRVCRQRSSALAPSNSVPR